MAGPLIIAHRGATSHAPENSIAALRAVSPTAAGAVEFDVQTTADGAFVLHHGPAVSGQRIADVDFTHLQDVRLSNGEPLPTLAGALETIHPALQALIEIKSLPEAHEDAFLAVIDRSSHPERCQVHSFDHRIIERLGRKHPALPRGLLAVARTVRPMSLLEDVGADILWQESPGVDKELVDELHQSDGRVYAWTVDDVSEIAAVAALGVDGICTNRPAVARQALEATPHT